MAFTAAAVQIASKMGDVAANLDKIAESAMQASADGADLAVFPECITSGYTIEAAAAETAMESGELAEEMSRRCAGLTKPLDIIVGFYEKADGQPNNSAAYIELDGSSASVKHVHRKVFLPTYGVFDELRHVQPGRDLKAFDTRLGRFGMLICEDVWHSILPAILAVQGADFIAVPAASPARGFQEDSPANAQRYARMLRLLAEEHGVYALLSGHIGFEGGKGLVGSSMIYSPSGEKLADAGLLHEAIVMAEADFEACSVARKKSPLLRDLKANWSLIQDLSEGD